MDSAHLLKQEILEINGRLLRLLTDGQAIPGMDGRSLAVWGGTCRAITGQISEGLLHVAVVGAIKSGKSTFTNALLGGDYLKRGAGVVTSIVTKVRRGPEPKATLWFKSWGEVNAHLQQALVLFPPFGHLGREPASFDIRRSDDRRRLAQALAGLEPDFVVQDGVMNANTVLLGCYLKGYDAVQHEVSSENRQLVYTGGDFSKHTAFVGDDAKAVYLKDIRLEIDTARLADGVEIADCQGSDSPNPLHLAMIQDYLMMTHLIVYVVSSRTGLRQADIRFLSMIKKMGILDNVLFVVNADFSEHDGIDDLKRLVERVRGELAPLRPNPEVYGFSVLYDLFRGQSGALPDKDRRRLEHWEGDPGLTAFSRDESIRFQSAFEHAMIRHRSQLLLHNHLERQDVVGEGLKHWVGLHHDVLSGDARGAQAIMNRVKEHQEQIDQVKSLIRSSLTGAVLQLKQALKTHVDRFFSERSGEVIGDTLDHIRNYRVSHGAFVQRLCSAGFTHTLYLSFQSFRQDLDGFVAENVNPAIIRFVQEQERCVADGLSGAVNPYHVMVRNVLAGYAGMMDQARADAGGNPGDPEHLPDIQAIKNLLGLSLPPMEATLHYSAQIKTDAAVRLGFYTVARFFRKVFKKAGSDPHAEKILALQDGIKRIKRDTEKAVVFHFKSYRENLKFQYLFRLVEACSSAIFDQLVERFQTYAMDLNHLMGLLDQQGGEKTRALEMLAVLAGEVDRLQGRIQEVREQLRFAG